MRRIVLLLLVVVALGAIPVLSPTLTVAAPAAPGPDFQYFPETGQQIGMYVRRFWEENGGLAMFGMPLTRQFEEDGTQVIYFERARFEINQTAPLEQRISLTRLGGLLTAERQNEEPFVWRTGSDSPDRVFFPESGHTLGGAFRYFWESRGGVKLFGFPISEEFRERSSDGQEYLVQYFERARFEYHPDLVGTPNEVQLSQLGRQLLAQRPAAQAQTAPVQPLQLVGRAVTGFPTSTLERQQNIARGASLFDGIVIQPGQEHSFLSAGNFTAEEGFAEGYAIVGGRLEKVIGGGICQVSTTLFRAVANAGLQVTRRSPHSHVVYFYENILGFDAAVFSPDLDFRWRNDTSEQIILSARTDIANATVTFELWGRPDGRTVSYRGPVVRNVRQPGKAVWQYDPALAPGQVVQIVHGRSGMDVNYYRTVLNADGSLRANDNWYSHYDPWEDFFSYGPGVKPPPGVTVIPPKR